MLSSRHNRQFFVWTSYLSCLIFSLAAFVRNLFSRAVVVVVTTITEAEGSTIPIPTTTVAVILMAITMLQVGETTATITIPIFPKRMIIDDTWKKPECWMP
jgi:hypothetical protein